MGRVTVAVNMDIELEQCEDPRQNDHSNKECSVNRLGVSGMPAPVKAIN